MLPGLSSALLGALLVAVTGWLALCAAALFVLGVCLLPVALVVDQLLRLPARLRRVRARFLTAIDRGRLS